MWHHKHIEKIRNDHYEKMFAVFRIAIGLLFAAHGAQKLFGWFGGNIADPLSLMWLAGVIEFLGGFFVAFGFLTLWVSILAVLEMAFAYLTVHAPNALTPIANRGELALLYLVAFAYIAFRGPGIWSLDAKSCKTCEKHVNG